MAVARRYEGRDPDPGDGYADLDELVLGPSAQGWLRYTDGELLAERDPAEALERFDRAIALARSGGNRFLEGVALVSSCSLRSRSGDLTAALGAFDTAVRHWQRLVSTTHQLTTLRNLVALLHRLDETTLVAELLGSVERHDVPTYGEEAERLARAEAWASGALGQRRFDEHAARGRGRPLSATEDWALAAIGANLARLGTRATV